MPATKREKESRSILELLLPFAGILVIALFFLPGFQRIIGTLLFGALGLLALSLVLGMGLYYRHMKNLAASGPPGPRAATPGVFQETWTIDLLRALEWKRFSQVVTAYSRELGYEPRGPHVGADGGLATPLYKGGRPLPAMLMQCRTWDVSEVGVTSVQELYATMENEKIGYGVFYSNGDFTPDALEFARGKVLDLVDGREFLSRIKQLEPVVQQRLLEEAIRGDYTSPTCPGCDIKMVLLPSEKAATTSEIVWVCRNHPHCARTLVVSRLRGAA